MPTRFALVALALAVACFADQAYAADPVLCQGLTEFSDLFCPYGYVPKTGSWTVTTVTVEDCCVRDTTHAAFPACNDTVSNGGAGPTGVQAPDEGDTNWSILSDSAFARTLGKYTGMCFSITRNNECQFGYAGVASTCCTTKAPAFLQFKIGNAAGVAISADPLRHATLDGLSKCKLAYGTDIANSRGLKRISALTDVEATGGLAQYYNVPLVFKKGQSQATVCIYSLDAPSTKTIDCAWQNLCGFTGASVPDDTLGYALGCEARLVGRVKAASSACCAPTYSVTGFDPTIQSRLANDANASVHIELSPH
jgi:hypothetical protein